MKNRNKINRKINDKTDKRERMTKQLKIMQKTQEILKWQMLYPQMTDRTMDGVCPKIKTTQDWENWDKKLTEQEWDKEE
jgi:hypothetical protein